MESVVEFLNRSIEIGGQSISIYSALQFFVLLAAAWVASRIIRKVLSAALGQTRLDDVGTRRTIDRLTHYAVMLVGLLLATQQALGINLNAIFAAGAFVAVGVGFALQNILQNFVSGIILLVERSIKEKDVLEVEGRLVQVEKIGARSTVARTREDHDVIIPNSILVQSSVTNYTLNDDSYRIHASVGVSYGSDQDQVERVLYEAAASVPNRAAKDPLVLLKGFGSSSVDYDVFVWANDPWGAPVRTSDLNRAIWNGLKAGGIQIPFPQLDLHLPGGQPLPGERAESDRNDSAPPAV